MSIAHARPVVPKGLMLASAAAILLHVLLTMALGHGGWAHSGSHSRLVTAVRGGAELVAPAEGDSGLHVRLARATTPVVPGPDQPLATVDDSLPDGAQRAGDDEVANVWNATAPAAGGAVSLASTYLPAEELDQAPTPEPGWVLDEAALERVGRARMWLRLWVSELGRIDRVALIHAEPAGAWAEQAIAPLPDTRMQPAERHGRPVAATIVVELTADLESMR